MMKTYWDWSCIYLDRKEQWMKHFLQNIHFGIQDTCSRKFLLVKALLNSFFDIICSYTIENFFNTLHVLKSLEMNFQVRKQDRIIWSWKSGENGRCCTCTILCFTKKHFLEKNIKIGFIIFLNLLLTYLSSSLDF